MTEETITIEKLAEVLVRCEARDLQVIPPRRTAGAFGPVTPLWDASAVRHGVMHGGQGETLAAACVALCAKLEEAAR
jgi:hypothetical protein